MYRSHRDLFVETTPHQRDLLAHRPLAKELARLLRTEATPLTLMINGPWGSGKTSFLRTLLERLKQAPSDDPRDGATATIWFDPWEHEDAPNIIVPFLKRLRQEAYRDDDVRRRGICQRV